MANCFYCGATLNGTELHCPSCGHSTAPKVVHTFPVWAMITVLAIVVLGVAAAITLQAVSLARTATTAELANAVVAVTQDVSTVVVKDGKTTRTTLTADGDKTREAIIEDGSETRKTVKAAAEETQETVVSEAAGIRDAIVIDGAVTRTAVTTAAQLNAAAVAKIEKQLRAHGTKLAIFANKANVAAGAPAIDLTGIATKADLAAMEGRLMAQSEIVVQPKGSASIKKVAAVPEKPAAGK